MTSECSLKRIKPYPYILIHGLAQFGTDPGENAIFTYWGFGSGNIVDELRREGVEVYAPTVESNGGNWHRACVLYAQLTGTRVDYGAAHSEKYGHDRYGDTYEKPLVEDWSSINRINLIGHSMGGPTAYTLASLMAFGNEEERAATGEDTSPLFKGGKEDWIFSVTALQSPLNGTTFFNVIAGKDAAALFNKVLPYVSQVLGSVLGKKNTAGDILARLGIKIDTFDMIKMFSEKTKTRSGEKDNGIYDCTITGSKELNAMLNTAPNVYYFSYPVDGTAEKYIFSFSFPFFKKRQVSTEDMKFFILRPVADAMGSYNKSPDSETPLGAEWLPNDGMVNTVSAGYPFGQPNKDFDEKDIRPGIWNVTSTRRGDHAMLIGGCQSMEWTRNFYMEQINRINELQSGNHE